MRYELQIEHTASGETQASLLLARIFGSCAEAETYLATRLAPLAAEMVGRPEIAPFARPYALLEELNMAVSVFPIDGELPMLIAATDPRQVLGLLRGAVPEEAGSHFEVAGCAVEPGHYGRQHRCVLRYKLDGSWVDADGRDAIDPGGQAPVGLRQGGGGRPGQAGGHGRHGAAPASPACAHQPPLLHAAHPGLPTAACGSSCWRRSPANPGLPS